jgi:hypothetical protein
VLYALYAFGLVDVGRIVAAFRQRLDLLVANIFCIVVMAIVAVVRHAWALRVLGVRIPLARVAGANLIGQGLGQWMPGSIVVSEGLRMGVLFGAQAGAHPSSSTLARIGIASLGDRLMGLGVAFLLGGTATTVLVLTHPTKSPALLVPLAVAYLIVGATLTALPLAGDAMPARALAGLLARPGRPGFVTRLTGAFASALRVAGDSSAEWRQDGRFLVTLALCALAAALNPIQLIFASAEVGGSIPWLVLMAAHPATYAGVLLPLGFAGFGAPQLVSVAVFAAFGVSAGAVIAMSLLQSTLLLMVQTALAFGWAALHGGEVVRGFRSAGGAR